MNILRYDYDCIMASSRISAVILGASGYAGLELARLLAMHPVFRVERMAGSSKAGNALGDLYPSALVAYPDQVLEEVSTAHLEGIDAVFLALPHGVSQKLVPQLVGKVGAIVDLGADFRFPDATLYEQAYGAKHEAPVLCKSFLPGLPELYRDRLLEALPGGPARVEGTALIAVPGCYPTAAALALWPLRQAGLLGDNGVIVNALSGISGSGATLSEVTHFPAAEEDVSAYNVPFHRHAPEMEQILQTPVTFIPHLVPMSRGMLATCYGALERSIGQEDLAKVLSDSYQGEPFVTVTENLPHSKPTRGSNVAHVSARLNRGGDVAVSFCALDNLVKGAAGQAIQCANLVFGLEEATGLPVMGVYP
jgi:N-acetyl-gamma-glutamyl-phosphate reductase